MYASFYKKALSQKGQNVGSLWQKWLSGVQICHILNFNCCKYGTLRAIIWGLYANQCLLKWFMCHDKKIRYLTGGHMATRMGLQGWKKKFFWEKIFFQYFFSKWGNVLCAPCKKNKYNIFILSSSCKMILKYISIWISSVKWNYMGDKQKTKFVS